MNEIRWSPDYRVARSMNVTGDVRQFQTAPAHTVIRSTTKAQARVNVSRLGLGRSGLRGCRAKKPVRPGSWPSGSRTPAP